MEITRKTKIKDVEKHPFVGITDSPLFIHCGINEINTPRMYDPTTFDVIQPIRKLVLEQKSLAVKSCSFDGNFNNVIDGAVKDECMVYFLPDLDGKLIHTDLNEDYVRIARVKLSNHELTNKLIDLKYYEESTKPNDIASDYSYILIRK